MLFVDGENLTLRGQEYGAKRGVEPQPGSYFMKDVFVWLPDREPQRLQNYLPWYLGNYPLVRAYYYTSLVGDDDKLQSVRHQLRQLGFDPQVFKKTAGQKSKGVDITLTKDMLSHAFLNHYDAAVLIAGDADYVPLVDEIKRRGKNIYIAFFAGTGLGLSPELRLRADGFHALEADFEATWRAWLQTHRQ